METSITFFKVNNGNCTLFNAGGCTYLFDINNAPADEDGNGGVPSWDLVRPLLRCDARGRRVIDRLCVSHGDRDHCGGFVDFKHAIDDGKLVIGEIWHCGYDRREHESMSELPDDYIALANEIDRRKGRTGFGEVERALLAGDRIDLEGDVVVHVVNPTPGSLSEGDRPEANEHSVAAIVRLAGLDVFLPGDTGCAAWQDNILHWARETDSLSWLRADVLVASHHGSHGFFGRDRQSVLNADPTPENYAALDGIGAAYLVLSAVSRFPHQDRRGEDPPHYAAYKWYHAWWQANCGIHAADGDVETHWRYTADGHQRLEYDGAKWAWNASWAPPRGAFVHTGGRTNRPRTEYA